MVEISQRKLNPYFPPATFLDEMLPMNAEKSQTWSTS